LPPFVAAKQFHLDWVIIDNQTATDHIFALDAHVLACPRRQKRLQRSACGSRDTCSTFPSASVRTNMFPSLSSLFEMNATRDPSDETTGHLLKIWSERKLFGSAAGNRDAKQVSQNHEDQTLAVWECGHIRAGRLSRIKFDGARNPQWKA